MRLGRWLGWCLLLGCGLLGAQARKPAERATARVFPQAWYAAALAGTTMPAPVTGLPVAAELTAAEYDGVSDYKGRSPIEEGRGPWHETHSTFVRDSKGRMRLEREGAYHPDIPETNMQHEATEVIVLDPVARCTFRWWVGALASHTVTASCMKKDAEFQAVVPWDEQNRAERVYRMMKPEAKFVNEPLHEKKMFGRVEAEGFRRFEVRKGEKGEEYRSYCGERWYAPALRDLVKSTTPVIGTRVPGDRIDFLATVTSLKEPAALLFYPPAGWAIEVAQVGGR